MKKVSVEQIIDAVEKVGDFQSPDSFMLSYQEFIAYFKNLESIEPHNLIICSHFVYGWMPRQIELKEPTTERLSKAAAILDKAKKCGRLAGEWEKERLVFLKGLINNSLVGTSKLLHFVNPCAYAIWDSHVYNYINNNTSYYQINKPENYLAYLENCEEITQDERFKPIHAIVNEKIGYQVTPYRAIEVIMYENGRQLR